MAEAVLSSDSNTRQIDQLRSERDSLQQELDIANKKVAGFVLLFIVEA